MNACRFGVVLLLLMAAAILIVPIVSANDESYNDLINASKGIKKYLTPDEIKMAPGHEPMIFDLQTMANKQTSPELNDRTLEFVYIIVPQTSIKKVSGNDTPGLVSIIVPNSSVKKFSIQAGAKAAIPDTSFAAVPSILGPIAILWAPKDMVEISATGDSMRLIVPENLLMKFENLADAQIQIGTSKTENLQIAKDTTPPIESKILSGAAAANDFQERSYYYDSACAHHINGVTGKIYPSGSYNYGESYFSYHEMEIYLSRSPFTSVPDVVEFVLYHRTDNQKRAFVAMWDEGISYTVLDIDATSVSYLEYYFYIDSSGVYTMQFRNPSTGTYYTATWNDSDNPSPYVRDLRGSTELLSLAHVPPLYAFNTVTSPIRVDYTRTVSGGFQTPSQTTTWNGYTPNMQYVNHLAFWNSNGGIDTSHQCGSGVA